MATRRCGDCKHFVVDGVASASSEGVCLAHIGDDDMPDVANVYADATNCKEFEELKRVHTDHSEFTWQKDQRAMRGFTEK